ncbi:MAG: DUF5107 domain-containing protein [Clostridiales bacterium]|jgi:hypothetical protein|nr:DUF5107 domain-containing protein [Clostridiales bacterium]
MPTKLEITTITMPCQQMNGESSLPPLSKLNFWHRNGDSGLSEDDELFIGYGHVPSPFPYRMQDMYTRPLQDTQMQAVVLENEYLIATFLPQWGGKLMSLFDKEKQKDLLYKNPVMRPCNLAFRNAWTSGGVEWNCGMFGHHVHTCEPMFTTTTKLDDGTPVLRMYEFERIRQVVQQMDFFLPAGSRVLFARNRIINPLPDVVPMYWWSNIAVPETPDTRIIVDADGAYVADNNTSLAPIPVYNGDDVTYPINVPAAGDYFYNIPPKNRKFEAAVDADGYGLIHTSTMRLKGRKLFCWGQNPGGDRWQEYLTEDGSADRYVELQAGLAHTQYECIPMPPHTTWEWLEAYGALQADGDKVHGEWEGAKAEVRQRLNAIVTDDEMDQILADTKKMATSAATGEMILQGSGWGALENMRRKQQGQPCMAPHLDFGTPGPEQADWICLLKRGFFPEHAPGEIPPSWMLQTEWVRMMEAAIEGGDKFSWYAHLQLGMTYLCMNRLDEAAGLLEKSMLLCPSCWAVYGMAHVQRQMENHAAAATLAAKAYRMRPTDVSLAKESMELLVDAKMYEDALELAAEMAPAMRTVGRVQLYTAQAHIRLDHIEEAEAVLYAAGGVALPDIREGELSITELYLDIAEKKAARDGVPFDRETAPVPPVFDYRQCDSTRRRPARKRVRG